MANDLTEVTDPTAMLSSTDLLRLRRISVGTVKWPNQPTRTYLSGSQSLSADDRRIAEHMLGALVASLEAVDQQESVEGRFGLVSKMLLAYPVANASAAGGRARGEAYLAALDDVPPWAIDRAVKRWHRGEAGDGHDYQWAPAPAVLRKLALSETEEARKAIDNLRALTMAIPLDRALDVAPLDAPNKLIPKLKSA